MGTKKKLLCLITGPSGSGKTCIALELKKRLSMATTLPTSSGSGNNNADGDTARNPASTPINPDTKRLFSVVVIHQDHYFTQPFLSYKERVDDSYENDSGIDWDGLFADVQLQLDGVGDDNNGDTGSDDGIKMVIVEGHLLGHVAARFREKFFACEKVGVLAVLLEGCSRESCKHRRLERKRERSEEEHRELAKYINDFVWPCFLKYGVPAMDALRRQFAVEKSTITARTTTTNATDEELSDSILDQQGVSAANDSISVLLEINNSEGASLEANANDIWIRVHNILSDRG
jgi:uridine kinase